MLRRDFVLAALGAVTGFPRRLVAQSTPVIGFLGATSPVEHGHAVAAFQRGLRQSGFVEGQNVSIAFRWAEGRYDRLPQLATDLVAMGVTVIVSIGGPQSISAAKRATSSTPIAFTTGADPVQYGHVSSLNQPGGNVTGIYFPTAALGPKRLELLHELVPRVPIIGALINPTAPVAAAHAGDLQAAAEKLNIGLRIVEARELSEFEAAFRTLVEHKAGALLVASDTYFNAQRQRLVDLAARHSLPAVYEWREFAEAGGLMTYGTNLADSYRQLGIYTGRILKGEKPADLPVMMPTRYELVINLKTAKALGLEVPPTLIARADDVIE